MQGLAALDVVSPSSLEDEVLQSCDRQANGKFAPPSLAVPIKMGIRRLSDDRVVERSSRARAGGDALAKPKASGS
jgi:hypothetical protein